MFILCAFLVGCTNVPPGTVSISERSELVTVANITADLIGAPVECSNWDRVGYYVTTSSEEYKSLAWGHENHAYTFYYVEDDSFDSIIFLDGEQESYVIAHEVMHHLLDCMGEDGNNNHQHPIWSGLNDYIYYLGI